MCGACCKGCAFLTDSGTKKICSIYKKRWFCDIYYPISKEQFDRVTKDCKITTCGYSFEDKK